MDIRPISTVHVIPISSDRVFMELRTRQAPVPQDNIIMPTLPTTEDFAERLARLIGVVSDLSAYSCHRTSI